LSGGLARILAQSLPRFKRPKGAIAAMAISSQTGAHPGTSSKSLKDHLAARAAFLAHFPGPKRGTIANWFLYPVRSEDASTAQAVLSCVTPMLHRRVAQDYNGDLAALALTIIDQHPDEALSFAAWALAWEQLTPDERGTIKADRHMTHVQSWMAERPPSDKQISYLQSLGHQGAPPATMKDASEAIDRLLAWRRR